MADQRESGAKIKIGGSLGSAYKLASRTGGSLSFKDGKPWSIGYKNGSILWTNHPKNEHGVHAATPMLEREHGGITLQYSGVVLQKDVVTFVNAGGEDNEISGHYVTEGDIHDFKIASALASENLILARNMAREESQRRSRQAKTPEEPNTPKKKNSSN